MRYKTFELKKASDDTYKINATTDDVDRDGEIVEPSGITNLKQYLSKNPVVLFGHDYQQPPVGKAVGGRVTDRAVELDIQFAETEWGKEVRYLYENGFMNSFSIGFIPYEHERGTERGDPWRWTEWELLEVSAVPVPANAAATVVRAGNTPLLKSALGGESEISKALDAEIHSLRSEISEYENTLNELKRHARAGGLFIDGGQ